MEDVELSPQDPLRWGWRDLLALGILAVVVLLPLPALLGASGAPMEEGFMLAFPEQLLSGRIPHRDFLHLYGPGSLWVLAALYELFGATLDVERAVGLVQHVAVAVALWVVLRPFGRVVATAGAALSAVILLSLGLAAMAWNGALAAALVAMAILAGTDRPDRAELAPRPWAMAVAGGLAAGALLYRPDMVLAVLAGLAMWWFQLQPPSRRPLAGGFLGVSLLWVVHLAMSGPAAALRGMVLEPVVELRGGRSLPVPPSWGEVDGFLQRAGTLGDDGWPLPSLPSSQQIALWFWLVPLSVVVVLGAAWWLRRTEAASLRARSYLPAALFAAALLPQAIQRPDTTHLSWVSAVTFPLLVAAVGVLVGAKWPASAMGVRIGTGVAVVAVILVTVIPSFPMGTWTGFVGETISGERSGVVIERDGRRFIYGNAADAAAAQEVVDELAERSSPGDTLVVGPSDLSRTVYSDAFLYNLFPDLVPGTRYIEMDPGIADAPDSDLAQELAVADWLVLSSVWDDWSEPNDSTDSRSQAANEVVETQFCEVAGNDRFRLLQRCD